jgi:N-acetylglucosaminyldiphosphoundecaprenol N-acetyl-beta-D-mannosaminyltransferase
MVSFNFVGMTTIGRAEPAPARMDCKRPQGAICPSGPMPLRSRVQIGGVPIDGVTLNEAIGAIDLLVATEKGGAVFTPNVDHIVEFEKNPRLREAYGAADLSLVDGMPVLWASRLLGRRLPEKISGSDIIEPLLRHAASRRWRVFLLGGQEGVAALAATRLKEAMPGLAIVGTLAPRIDMAQPREHREAIVEVIRAARPHLVLVAFGAPKQELWIHEAREALRPAVFLGVGASLDFIAGTLPRAPVWVSRSGLEWLYRLAREPRRLWRRYLLRDPRFLVILWRELLPKDKKRGLP